MDFKENEKKKNEKGNFFEGCLVKRGREENDGGPTKKNSLQNGEKTWWGKIL